MKKFTNPNDPDNIAIKKAIHSWLEEIYALEEKTYAITIEEINCSEPSCVHTETKITLDVLISEKPKLYEKKIMIIWKPLVFIRKTDIMEMQKPKKIHNHKHYD